MATSSSARRPEGVRPPGSARSIRPARSSSTTPARRWSESRTQDIKKYRPALVIWWSRYEVGPRLGPDGKVLPLGSRAYWRAQQASFEERARALTKRGARLVTVQIEPPGPALAARNPSEKYFLVGQTLLHRPDVVNAWNAFLASHKGPTVFSISIDHLVCHDAKSPCDDTLPNGETARPDGVHYSTAAQRVLARRSSRQRGASLNSSPPPCRSASSMNRGQAWRFTLRPARIIMLTNAHSQPERSP